MKWNNTPESKYVETSEMSDEGPILGTIITLKNDAKKSIMVYPVDLNERCGRDKPNLKPLNPAIPEDRRAEMEAFRDGMVVSMTLKRLRDVTCKTLVDEFTSIAQTKGLLVIGEPETFGVGLRAVYPSVDQAPAPPLPSLNPVPPLNAQLVRSQPDATATRSYASDVTGLVTLPSRLDAAPSLSADFGDASRGVPSGPLIPAPAAMPQPRQLGM